MMTTRSVRTRLAVAGVVGATALSLAAPAYAGGKTSPSSPSGACSVNPNPVAVGANYTLTGTGLGAGAIVNVQIADSGGTTSWNLQADSAGTASVTWHSYATGTSKVAFLEGSRHGTTTVAACSFIVT